MLLVERGPCKMDQKMDPTIVRCLCLFLHDSSTAGTAAALPDHGRPRDAPLEGAGSNGLMV